MCLQYRSLAEVMHRELRMSQSWRPWWRESVCPSELWPAVPAYSCDPHHMRGLTRSTQLVHCRLLRCRREHGQYAVATSM